MTETLRTDKHGSLVHIYPSEEHSLLKAIINIKGKKCFNMNDINELHEYLELEYFGDEHPGLEHLGIQKIR